VSCANTAELIEMTFTKLATYSASAVKSNFGIFCGGISPFIPAWARPCTDRVPVWPVVRAAWARHVETWSPPCSERPVADSASCAATWDLSRDLPPHDRTTS